MKAFESGGNVGFKVRLSPYLAQIGERAKDLQISLYRQIREIFFERINQLVSISFEEQYIRLIDLIPLNGCQLGVGINEERCQIIGKGP